MNHDSITYEYWLEVDGDPARESFCVDLDSADSDAIRHAVLSWATYRVNQRIDRNLLQGRSVRIYERQEGAKPYLMARIDVTTQIVTRVAAALVDVVEPPKAGTPPA